MSDDNPIKRWTAKRKTAVVMDILKGKTTVAEVAHRADERWAMDLTHVWCGKDRRAALAVVITRRPIDCFPCH